MQKWESEYNTVNVRRFRRILERGGADNEKFKNKIYKVLENGNNNAKRSRKKNVIIKPKLNPLEVILEGERILMDKLLTLEISDLKDIIKFYEMDNTNSSSRWRKKERLVNYIVDVSKSRISRGNAFRE